MSLIRINHQPNPSQLRVFAGAWLLFFGTLAAFTWVKDQRVAAMWLAAGAVAIPVTGLLAPAWLRLVYLGMCYATWPIGWVVSHAILALVYYVVLTPIGLTLRVFRYDPLSRRFDRSAESYWKARGVAPPPERYFRQH